MSRKVAGIRDSAVKKATDKTWDEWIEFLDGEGAREMTHKEIVALLYNKGYILNRWWCQQVTVGYEMVRGLRVVGQTASAGFQVGVTRTFPITGVQAWDLITKPEGRNIWLGTIPQMRLDKGAGYETEEGTSGEIRSITEGSHLRLTWKPRDWDEASTLQIRVLPGEGKATIRIHHEKLASAEIREEMGEYWGEVLDRFQHLISGSEE